MVSIAAAVGFVVAAGAGRVDAHTEVDSVVPADGSVVDEAVDAVVIVFKREVAPTGSGFEILTPSGDLVVPVSTSADGRRFVLSADPPLAGGEVAVRYEVRAEDGHTISGGFRFTIESGSPEPEMDMPEMDMPEMDAASHAAMVESSVAPVGLQPSDLPVAIYPTMGAAAAGGLFAAARLRARTRG